MEQCLNPCFLCKHCVPEWKGAIEANKQTLQYKKGQPIFQEGEAVQGIYFIVSGAAKVHQSWGSDKELILHFASAGDVLGHRGQGSEAIFPISSTALENTRVCFISSAFMETTLKTNPPFLYAMMQLYAVELRKAEKRMRNLALMDVKGRIAVALLTLEETFGLDAKGFIKVPVTRLDIAAFAGTTYETVFRQLSDWSAAGYVETVGKSVRINASGDLRAFIPY